MIEWLKRKWCAMFHADAKAHCDLMSGEWYCSKCYTTIDPWK